VKEFVASTQGQLRLFVLPAYSPQLNPDEWVWKNVKHDRVGRTSVTGPDDFRPRSSARSADCRNSRTSFGFLRRPRPPVHHRMIRVHQPTNSLVVRKLGCELVWIMNICIQLPTS
jgi:DDE superfamily endonuclease